MRSEAEVREQLASYQICLGRIRAEDAAAPTEKLENRIADLGWVLGAPAVQAKAYDGTAGRIVGRYEVVVVNATGRWGKVLSGWEGGFDEVATSYLVMLDGNSEVVEVEPGGLTPVVDP